MQSNGYAPKLESRSRDTYRLEGYGGLILKNNGFICFSESDNGQFKSYGAKKTTNLSGNAIDFVMWFFKVSFVEAVEMLIGQPVTTENEKKEHPIIKKSDTPTELVLPTQAQNYKRLFAYLTKTRCIDARVIQMCLDKKLMYQDNNGNVVFLWYDCNSKIVGANLRGTLTDIPFKQNLSGSDFSNGFRIPIGKPKQLLVFEATIDALSMLTMKPNLTDTLILAMCNLNSNSITKALNDYPAITKAYICVDNDKPSTEFYNNLNLSVPFERVSPKNHKDWNETLIASKRL